MQFTSWKRYEANLKKELHQRIDINALRLSQKGSLIAVETSISAI